MNDNIYYNILIAESELIDDITLYHNQLFFNEYISESTIEYITEGIKDTLVNYFNKVMDSIQKAWNKFKAKIQEFVNSKLIKTVREKVSKGADITFNIKNCPTYNNNYLNTVKVPAFDERMIEDLQDQDTFVQKYLPAVYDGNKSINDVMSDKFMGPSTDVVVDTNFIDDAINFCEKDYSALQSSVEDDLGQVNATKNNVDGVLRGVVESSRIITLSMNMILEASGDGNNGSDNGKMSFSDNGGNDNNSEQQKEQKDKNTKLVKACTNYMKVAGNVLSAKMKCIMEEYKNKIAILTHYLEVIKNKEKTGQPTDGSDNNAPAPETGKQIEI